MSQRGAQLSATGKATVAETTVADNWLSTEQAGLSQQGAQLSATGKATVAETIDAVNWLSTEQAELSQRGAQLSATGKATGAETIEAVNWQSTVGVGLPQQGAQSCTITLQQAGTDSSAAHAPCILQRRGSSPGGSNSTQGPREHVDSPGYYGPDTSPHSVRPCAQGRWAC